MSSSLEDQLKPILLGWNAQDLWPSTNVVFLPWSLLLLLPRWKWTSTLTLVVPLFHSLIYAAGIVSLLLQIGGGGGDGEEAPPPPPDFSSLQGIVEMFQDPNTVFIGWIHYVAFDCLVGRMIVLDSIERGASWMFHVVAVAPCLILTLLLGPTGFLLYMILRQLFLPASATSTSTSTTDPIEAGSTGHHHYKAKVF